MKKILLIALLLAGVAAIALWMSPELRRQTSNLLRDADLHKASTETVYKWRDRHGVWQYTQSLPPAGVQYQEMEVHPDTNLLPLPDQLKPK